MSTPVELETVIGGLIDTAVENLASYPVEGTSAEGIRKVAAAYRADLARVAMDQLDDLRRDAFDRMRIRLDAAARLVRDLTKSLRKDETPQVVAFMAEVDTLLARLTAATKLDTTGIHGDGLVQAIGDAWFFLFYAERGILRPLGYSHELVPAPVIAWAATWHTSFISVVPKSKAASASVSVSRPKPAASGASSPTSPAKRPRTEPTERYKASTRYAEDWTLEEEAADLGRRFAAIQVMLNPEATDARAEMADQHDPPLDDVSFWSLARQALNEWIPNMESWLTRAGTAAGALAGKYGLAGAIASDGRVAEVVREAVITLASCPKQAWNVEEGYGPQRAAAYLYEACGCRGVALDLFMDAARDNYTDPALHAMRADAPPEEHALAALAALFAPDESIQHGVAWALDGPADARLLVPTRDYFAGYFGDRFVHLDAAMKAIREAEAEAKRRSEAGEEAQAVAPIDAFKDYVWRGQWSAFTKALTEARLEAKTPHTIAAVTSWDAPWLTPAVFTEAMADLYENGRGDGLETNRGDQGPPTRAAGLGWFEYSFREDGNTRTALVRAYRMGVKGGRNTAPTKGQPVDLEFPWAAFSNMANAVSQPDGSVVRVEAVIDELGRAIYGILNGVQRHAQVYEHAGAHATAWYKTNVGMGMVPQATPPQTGLARWRSPSVLVYTDKNGKPCTKEEAQADTGLAEPPQTRIPNPDFDAASTAQWKVVYAAHLDEQQQNFLRRVEDTWEPSLRGTIGRMAASDKPEDQAAIQAMVEDYNRRWLYWLPYPEVNEVPPFVRLAFPAGKTPHLYQIAAVNRIERQGGGLLAFDVGVGKTFTAIMAAARLKQIGKVKRPVFEVPNAIMPQWRKQIHDLVPGWRVLLFGGRTARTKDESAVEALVGRVENPATKRPYTRAEAEAAIPTELRWIPDSKQARAEKWAAWQAGHYDLMLMARSANATTAIDADVQTRIDATDPIVSAALTRLMSRAKAFNAFKARVAGVSRKNGASVVATPAILDAWRRECAEEFWAPKLRAPRKTTDKAIIELLSRTFRKPRHGEPGFVVELNPDQFVDAAGDYLDASGVPTGQRAPYDPTILRDGVQLARGAVTYSWNDRKWVETEQGKSGVMSRANVDKKRIQAIAKVDETPDPVSLRSAGVDFLVSDEAQAFKNLIRTEFRPISNRGKIAYLGTQVVSPTAWQMYLRAEHVRANARENGMGVDGQGILWLTATPAKNSPMEFDTAIAFTSRRMFALAGVGAPDRFFHRYVLLKMGVFVKQDLSSGRTVKVGGFPVPDRLGEFNAFFRASTIRRTADDTDELAGREVVSGVQGVATKGANVFSDKENQYAFAFLRVEEAPILRITDGLCAGVYKVVGKDGDSRIIVDPPMPADGQAVPWNVRVGSRVPFSGLPKRIEVEPTGFQSEAYEAQQARLTSGQGDALSAVAAMYQIAQHPALPYHFGTSPVAFMRRVVEAAAEEEDDDADPQGDNEAEEGAEAPNAGGGGEEGEDCPNPPCADAAEAGGSAADAEEALEAEYTTRLAATAPTDYVTALEVALTPGGLVPLIDGARKMDDIVDPQSPKIDAVCDAIVAELIRRPACGHLVFAESLALQAWLRVRLYQKMVLARSRVQANPGELGLAFAEVAAVLDALDPNRVGVMNAQVGDTYYRADLARAFNGEWDLATRTPKPGGKPSINVVIANSVAYEGVDLQARTCAIHHLDLPYEPATFIQRNGRAVRQGNVWNEVSVRIYLTKGTVDYARLDLLEGKRSWIDDVLGGRAAVSLGDDSSEVDAVVRAYPPDKEADIRAKLDPMIAAIREEDARYEARRLRSLLEAYRIPARVRRLVSAGAQVQRHKATLEGIQGAIGRLSDGAGLTKAYPSLQTILAEAETQGLVLLNRPLSECPPILGGALYAVRIAKRGKMEEVRGVQTFKHDLFSELDGVLLVGVTRWDAARPNANGMLVLRGDYGGRFPAGIDTTVDATGYVVGEPVTIDVGSDRVRLSSQTEVWPALNATLTPLHWTPRSLDDFRAIAGNPDTLGDVAKALEHLIRGIEALPDDLGRPYADGYFTIAARNTARAGANDPAGKPLWRGTGWLSGDPDVNRRNDIGIARFLMAHTIAQALPSWVVEAHREAFLRHLAAVTFALENIEFLRTNGFVPNPILPIVIPGSEDKAPRLGFYGLTTHRDTNRLLWAVGIAEFPGKREAAMKARRAFDDAVHAWEGRRDTAARRHEAWVQKVQEAETIHAATIAERTRVHIGNIAGIMLAYAQAKLSDDPAVAGKATVPKLPKLRVPALKLPVEPPAFTDAAPVESEFPPAEVVEPAKPLVFLPTEDDYTRFVGWYLRAGEAPDQDVIRGINFLWDHNDPASLLPGFTDDSPLAVALRAKEAKAVQNVAGGVFGNVAGNMGGWVQGGQQGGRGPRGGKGDKDNAQGGLWGRAENIRQSGRAKVNAVGPNIEGYVELPDGHGGTVLRYTPSVYGRHQGGLVIADPMNTGAVRFIGAGYVHPLSAVSFGSSGNARVATPTGAIVPAMLNRNTFWAVDELPIGSPQHEAAAAHYRELQDFLDTIDPQRHRTQIAGIAVVELAFRGRIGTVFLSDIGLYGEDQRIALKAYNEHRRRIIETQPEAAYAATLLGWGFTTEQLVTVLPDYWPRIVQGTDSAAALNHDLNSMGVPDLSAEAAAHVNSANRARRDAENANVGGAPVLPQAQPVQPVQPASQAPQDQQASA